MDLNHQINPASKKLEKAVKFVCDRKDLFFTECSVAEEIFDVCKQALEEK